MRATFLAGGEGHRARARSTPRTIDLAPTLAYILGIPEPQQSQGRVLLDVVKGGNDVKPISIVGLNDFHGQLDPTTLAVDGINVAVGGAAPLATMFDEELGRLPGRALLLAGGDNVAPRRRTRRLLQDMPAIDVENRGASTRRRTATTSSTTASTRLLAAAGRAHFPFLAANIVDDGDRATPPTGSRRRTSSTSTASRSA